MIGECGGGATDRADSAIGWNRIQWLVGVIAIACFANILANGFCYDDNPVVRFNDKVTGRAGWSAIWTTDYWSQTESESPHRDLLYRPIALSVFRLTYAVAGDRAWAFHLLSIGLHAVVSILVVRVARAAGFCPFGALAGGLSFAVLPIHTEVVAGVVGQADLTATGGTLAAILFHDRFRRSSRSAAAGWATVGALAAFVAMGAKESGIAVVPIVVLWDQVVGGRGCDKLARCERGSTGTVRRLSYLVPALTVYAALRFHALGGQLHQAPAPTKTVNVLVDAPAWQHVLGVVQLWGMYWGKMLWPAKLCVEYAINSVRLATSVLDIHVLIGAVVFILLLAAAVFAWRHGRHAVAFIVGALLLGYLPAANALVLIQVFFAERIWYLPSAFAVLLFGISGDALPRRRAWRAAATLVLLAMLGRCWIRNTEWRDNGTLFAAAYRDHPDSVQALHLYGQWLVHHGEFERGVELVDRALAIDVGFTDAHRTLGTAYLLRGQYEAALMHLRIAEMQAPGHPATRAALEEASAAHLAGDAGRRLRLLEETAKALPDNVEAQLALVRALRDLGHSEAAVDRLREGESRFGGVFEWQAEYAVTLVFLDRRDDAIGRYRRALGFAPESTQSMIELAMLLIERRGEGDVDEADRLAEQAGRRSPDEPGVLACRAEVRALRGDVTGAAALYRRAANLLDSNDPRQRMFKERAKALGG